MEIVSLVGVALGVLAVFGGALLEGVPLGTILQPTAAFIVFGGTLGAVLVAYPRQDIRNAFKLLRLVFEPVETDVRPVIDEIIRIATVARKEGILAVEGLRGSIQEPLFRKGIKYVIDGFEPQTVKEILESEIDLALDEEEAAAKVWEGAGSYAPTVGIVGAVLGLIHVMGNLSDPGKLGSGIAVAFVATIYGVGSANLLFLPFGTKIKRKSQMRAMAREVVTLGVSGIQEGLNPHFLREKLEVFVDEQLRTGTPAPEASAGS